VVYHPEVIFFKNQIVNSYYTDYLADINISAIQYLDSQSLLTPIMLFPQLLFIIYIGFLFVSFYFSFYSSSSKEESTVDSDYLTTSVVAESEKELGSIDDILMLSVIVVYAFGWYFYLFCWNLFSSVPELALVFFFSPILYFIILNTPTLLLYDFGILFTCYLKGVSSSNNLFFELLFDYIAVMTYYLRVITQFSRLVLMLSVYVGMHDYIIYMDFSHKYLMGNESIWEEISDVSTSVTSVTYFFLAILPGFLLNWMYEVIHMFFVVTGQIVTYLGMVFWLFLLLFSFFVVEKQENYFEEKRKRAKKHPL
jgi:hypothetical protein